jgi:hypothetical protein
MRSVVYEVMGDRSDTPGGVQRRHLSGVHEEEDERGGGRTGSWSMFVEKLVGMTDVAATELIAESSEDREQGRDAVAAVSDLLRGRNEWNIEMRGRARVESKAALEAERGSDKRSTPEAPQVETHTHTHTHTKRRVCATCHC